MERNIIKIDEAGLKDDLKTLIRGTVEDTLNAMLDEEAASFCNAEKHERSEGRRNYRSGHYHRKLLTGAGERDIVVTLRRNKQDNSRAEKFFAFLTNVLKKEASKRTKVRRG